METLSPTDPRTRLAAAVATAGAVLRGVRPDQLDDPTPCPDFDVRALQAHLVDILHRLAAIGRGEDPFALDVPADADWTEGAHAVQAAWTDDATLERIVTLPWATAPGGDILVGYAGEITVHTWDLARATGQEPAWDEATLEAVWPMSQRALPAEGRQASFDEVRARMGMPADSPPPYADAVPVPDDAPLIDRIVAWHGRRP